MKKSLQNLGIYTFILILGGLVFGAYLTVPMWVERANIGLEGGISYDVLPGSTWKHLIYWSSYRLRLFTFSGQHWYGAYLGISLILLTGLGYVGIIGRKQHPRASLLASSGLCLICSLILVFNRHLPVIDTLSVVRALQPGRYLLFVIFFLSIMVGGGVTLIVPRLSSRLQNRHYTLCLLFILCDLGPTTFQHPYISFETEANLAGLSKRARQELQNQSAEFQNSTLPNYRYFYFRDKPIGFSPNAWMPIHTGVPSVSHVYTKGPLAVDNFYEKFNRQVEPIFHTFEKPNDLTASDQSHWIAAGFYLLNVRHIFFIGPPTIVFYSGPFEETPRWLSRSMSRGGKIGEKALPFHRTRMLQHSFMRWVSTFKTGPANEFS